MLSGKSLALSFVVLFLAPSCVLAYDDTTTHPALTQEIARRRGFSNSDAKDLVQGSIDEDFNPRYLNHFYDPVNDGGLTLGYRHMKSSKVWLRDDRVNEFTWDRGVFEYVWGDRAKGIKILGHVLHLIQDASVPDHTRDDPHPPVLELGSPYEAWTKKYSKENFVLPGDLSERSFENIEDAITSMARYSNSNFYSKDTISSKYQQPSISELKGEEFGEDIFNVGISEGGVILSYVSVNPIDGSMSYSLKGPGNLVLSDYWRLLSREAVAHGIGVVDLFFKEVEKEKESKVLYEKYKPKAPFFERAMRDVRVFLGLDDFEYPKVLANQPASLIEAVLPEQSVPEIDELIEVPVAQKVPTVPEVAPWVEAPVPAVPESPLLPEVAQAPATTEAPSVSTPSAAPSVSFSPGFGGGAPAAPMVAPNPAPEPIVETAVVATSTPPEVTPQSEEVVPPNTPPTVTILIDQCEFSVTIGECRVATNTATARWSSPDSDLSHFEITFNGQTSTTTETATSTFVAFNETKQFSVRAFDLIGSSSPVVLAGMTRLDKGPVFINEIAWAGSAASAAAEWVEIKNASELPVNLSVLSLNLGNGTTFPLSGTLPPGGLYLVEADEGAVPQVSADLVASFGTGISNSGRNSLVLSNVVAGASTGIDSTFTCQDWCGRGNATDFKTAERISATLLGTDPNSWLANEPLISRREGIAGTPKMKNSMSYSRLPNQITQTTRRLMLSESPYVLVTSDLRLDNQGVLEVEPGVVIKSRDVGILALGAGAIRSLGTAESPVVFTSLDDGEFGENLNPDAVPVAGGWDGLSVNFSIIPSTFLDTKIRYASTGLSFATTTPLDISRVQFENVLVATSSEQ